MDIFLKNSLERLEKGSFTYFLDEVERKKLESILKKDSYQVFELYPNCEKVIFYKEELPDLILLEVTSKNPLEHRVFLGSLFSFGIDRHVFGDIVILNGVSYVVFLPSVGNMIKNQLTKLGKEKVVVKEVSLSTLKDYEKKYSKIELKVPSMRVDAVLSKLLHVSRSNITEKILNKEILLNYEILQKGTKELKERDILSIRRYGKYRYLGMIGISKKNDYYIEIEKYD